MTKVRKLIFWLHLIAGVVAGSIILVMSVTGVLLAYEKQITAWLDGGRISEASHARLQFESLLANVRNSQTSAVPSMIMLRANPSAPVAFTFGRDRVVLADPYTGKVLGNAGGARDFFHLITDWHRWLGTSEKGRAVGRGITGACNLAFLFIVISGFYLWWPRKWSRASLKAITVFNKGLQGKARHWNWHNVIGFWSAPILLLIVTTGVIMSYPWANNLLYRLTGSTPPPQRGSGQSRDSKPLASFNFDGFNELLERSTAEVPDWKTITVRVPSSADAPVNVTIDRCNGGQPNKRLQLTYNLKSGDVTRETFESYNLGRKLRLWARFVHTGEAGGFLGQFIALLASCGAAVLVYTGLLLTWRRFRERKRPRPAVVE